MEGPHHHTGSQDTLYTATVTQQWAIGLGHLVHAPYGLPKISKPKMPLRPIDSCIDTPSYKLSKYIASPLAGKTDSHILNFTNVPIDEAVNVIHRKLMEKEPVKRTPLPAERILQLCLKSTYFSSNGEFYEQRQGERPWAPLSLQ